MPQTDRPEAVPGARASTAVPISPRTPAEPRSFVSEAPTYTFIEEHRAPAPSDEDRVSRR